VSLDGGGECVIPAVGDSPEDTVFTCDTTQQCCISSVSVGVNVGKFYNPTQSFGPLECNVSIGGTVGASLGGAIEEGPGCNCDGQVTAQLSATGSVSGSVGCDVSLLGHQTGVIGKVSADACLGGVLSIGCVDSLAPAAKATFSISIPTIKIGFLQVPAFVFTESVGGGCQ